jgi:hypothetical protein
MMVIAPKHAGDVLMSILMSILKLFNKKRVKLNQNTTIIWCYLYLGGRHVSELALGHLQVSTIGVGGAMV